MSNPTAKKIKRVGSDSGIQQIGVTAEESLKNKKVSVSDEIIKKFQMEPDAKPVTDSDNTVFVYNISNSNFHVPYSGKPDDADGVVKFEVGEIRPFDKTEIENKYFKKCFMDGKLKLVTEDQAVEIRKARKKEQGKGDKKVGLHPSGLPQNTKMALDYIYSCEDIDELEAFTTIEDREVLLQAIEDRIDDLES